MGRPKLIEDDELLAIARRVFLERGHTATMHHVAKVAGVSEAALFKRFETKDALFLAALNDSPADSSVFALIDPTLEPRRYLLEFSTRAKHHFRQVMPTILGLFAHPKYGKEMMRRIHQYNRIGDILPVLQGRLRAWEKAEQIRTINLTSFLHAYLHALHSMAMLDVLAGEADKPTPRAEMESFVDLFWETLRPLDKKRGSGQAQATARRRRPS